MLTLARGMLNGDYDNFLDCLIGCVIDEIWIVSRHQLAYALNILLPPDLRKQNKVLK
jgi:hypothetical protein